jgi:glucose-1-phosphate cytidylyltransferase
MKTVILAGGIGSRLQEATSLRPKPMVEIGGLPMLWHVMQIYARHGFKEFVIALGYKGEVIKEYFLNHYYLNHDFTIHLQGGKPRVHGRRKLDWTVHLVDTGLDTETGGRLRRLKSWLKSAPFFMTYGDGVANVDVRRLLAFHRRHGKLATITAVRPPARFGGLVFSKGRVDRFTEKPQIGEGWINGGFFVLEPEVLDYLQGDDTVFERTTLERLAREGQLMAYQHDDFWQCMDNVRDVRYLEECWASGRARWISPTKK